MNLKGSEQAFFSVLFNTDIWSIMKKFMYVTKKKSTIANYRNGYMRINTNVPKMR